MDNKRDLATARVRVALGYPDDGRPLAAVMRDADVDLLRERAAALAGCTEGSDEEAELEVIADAIETFTL